MFLDEALRKASDEEMDLVEVGKGDIPTCKILDYGKMKYQESKKEKKKEKKTHEIQFRPIIAEHDLNVKIRSARKFLEKGSNVHFVVQFKGREAAHPEIGKELLNKALVQLSDISIVLRHLSAQDKRMDVILAPKAN